MSKPCIKCGHVKPLSEFYRQKGMRDGHLNKCKSCCREDATANRTENLPRVRAYDRERSKLPHRREHNRRVSKQWRERYPIRYWAHTTLNNAVRDGRIIKPERCEDCGKKRRLHAHHHDYHRPLDVRWLCVPCHAAVHRERKRRA